MSFAFEMNLLLSVLFILFLLLIFFEIWKQKKEGKIWMFRSFCYDAKNISQMYCKLWIEQSSNGSFSMYFFVMSLNRIQIE